MPNNTYLWVGGAGSGMDRFDFNYPGNWLSVKIDNAISDPNDKVTYTSTIQIPGPGDNVWIGTQNVQIYDRIWRPTPTEISPNAGYWDYIAFTPPRYKYDVKAPLLFGGFSGDENGGTWLDKNGNGISGTTWDTALNNFIFGVNARPGENPAAPIINPIILGYGFPVIGGGITSSVATKLEPWYPDLGTAVDTATQRQKNGLVIKANTVRIDKHVDDDDFNYNDVNTQRYSYVAWKVDRSGTIPAGLCSHEIQIKLVKNFGYISPSPVASGTQKSFRNVVTTVSGKIWRTSVKLIDSYIKDVFITSEGTYYSTSSITPSNRGSISMNNIEFSNCVLWTVNVTGNTYFTMKTSSDTIFYFISSNQKIGWGSTASQPSNVLKSKFEGIGNPITAYRNIFPGSLTGPTAGAPSVIYVSQSENTSLSYCPDVVLGPGLTGPEVTVLGNFNLYGNNNGSYRSRWNVVLEPGIFIPKLTLRNCYALAPRTNESLYKNVNIGELYVNNNSILDMYTQGRSIWKIGTVQGNTLIGGINMDSTGKVILGENTRLLNYAVIKNVNKRTGGIQPVTTNPQLDITEER